MTRALMLSKNILNSRGGLDMGSLNLTLDFPTSMLENSTRGVVVTTLPFLLGNPTRNAPRTNPVTLSKQRSRLAAFPLSTDNRTNRLMNTAMSFLGNTPERPRRGALDAVYNITVTTLGLLTLALKLVNSIFLGFLLVSLTGRPVPCFRPHLMSPPQYNP